MCTTLGPCDDVDYLGMSVFMPRRRCRRLWESKKWRGGVGKFFGGLRDDDRDGDAKEPPGRHVVSTAEETTTTDEEEGRRHHESVQ